MSSTVTAEKPFKQFFSRLNLTAKAPGDTKWDIALGIIFIHAGALLAPFTFTWPAFWVFLVLQTMTGMVGITLCYHRLLTHRSFAVPKWLEYFFSVCGVLAMQGGPLKWVATHRIHHAFSDRPQDPHSPNKGFWWAHMFWLFPYDEMLDDHKKSVRFVPDLVRDRVQVWLERNQVLIALALAVGLYAFGGLPFLIWGFFLRAAVVYHCTWLVNSAAHVWGYQSYTTNEGSRNNWWVAILTYGEGWHNNHHAYPTSAAHGLRWWEVDLTYLTIRMLAWMKLASGIRLPQGGPAALPKFDPLAASKKLRLAILRPTPTL